MASLLGALLVATALPTAFALEAGGSGRCYDGPGDGGEAQFIVNGDGVTQSGFTDGSAAIAFITYLDDQWEGSPEPYCEMDQPGVADEYMEIHVDAGVIFVQGCYAGQDPQTGFHTTPECPTRLP